METVKGNRKHHRKRRGLAWIVWDCMGNRFCASQNPWPSYTKMRIAVPRRLRNTNNDPEKGSVCNFSWHNCASESMPLRPSTGSTATRMRICGVTWEWLANHSQINGKEPIMRRKGAGHLYLSASDPSAPCHYYCQSSTTDSAQSESSHCRSSTSRFQRGGLPGLVEPFTFSRALRFVSRLARA